MQIVIGAFCVFVITTFLVVRQKKFGKIPSGKRLAKIESSPNYKNGRFYNLHEARRAGDESRLKAEPGHELGPDFKSPKTNLDQAFGNNPQPEKRQAKDTSRFKAYCKFFFGKRVRVAPGAPIPFVKTDLSGLDGLEPRKDTLLWFGHSSYFMQIAGKTILVDPVFSRTGSPFSFITKAFEGTLEYTANDMPLIDYLFITHDH